MTIQELKSQYRKKASDARKLYQKITDQTPEAEARKIEAQFNALILDVDELRDQIADAEDRAAENTPDPRRPVGENREARGDGMILAPGEKSFALRKEERMVAWAAARKPDDEMAQLSTGRFLRSMLLGATNDLERRALSEGTDSAGGYTVPSILSAQLIDALRAESVVFRAGAQIVPLTSDSHSIAAVAADPMPAWRDENASVAESEPTFRNVPMRPKSLAVLTRLSRELFEDSLNLEQELPRILAAALAVELDRVALLGTGTAPEPRGIANTSGIGTTAHNAALTTYAPFVAARTGILSANAGPVNAIIMHPRDAGTMSGLTASDGQPLAAPRVIEETPMLTTTSIPVDGGAGTDESTIFAGNFAHLLVGMRAEVRIEILRERYADVMQYGMLAHLRADVAVQHASAFHTITGVRG